MSRYVHLSVLLLVVLLLGLSSASPSRVDAHGKDVQIVLRCAPTNSERPLDQQCLATVSAANDGDPVEDAQLVLHAVRDATGDEIDAVAFQPTGDPGRYAASVSLPAYGEWSFTAAVEAPAEGNVRLTEEVLPPSVGPAGAGQARAQLVISFNSRDVANLAALIAHLLGTLLLFSGIGTVLLVGLLTKGSRAIEYRRQLTQWFPWAAGMSFGLIAASGVYNAIYNAPTRSPGLLHPGTIAELPFGTAYVIAFAVKLGLAALLFVGTALLAVRLRRALTWSLPTVAGGALPALPADRQPRRGSLADDEREREESRRAAGAAATFRTDACATLAAANLLIGGCLLITVLVVDYLHLLSHIGAFTG